MKALAGSYNIRIHCSERESRSCIPKAETDEDTRPVNGREASIYAAVSCS